MNQSGVSVNADVVAAFQDPKSAALILVIVDEQFVLKTSTWERQNDADLFRELRDQAGDDQPYIALIRVGSKWVMLAWTPDTAPIYQRMLYASSRSGLKTDLGLNSFLPDWHISNSAEFNLESFKTHLQEGLPDPPEMTSTQHEKDIDAGLDGPQPVAVRLNAMPKIELQRTDTLYSVLEQFKDKQVGHIVVALDKNQESFVISSSGAGADLDVLGASLPAAEPRFVLFAFSDNNVLVHYSPEDSERLHKMAYSAFKRNLLEAISNRGIVVGRSIQLADQEEFTMASLSKQLLDQPIMATSTIQFSKPPRPGRGSARMH